MVETSNTSEASSEMKMDIPTLQSELKRLQSLIHSFSILNSSLDLQKVLRTSLNTAIELLNSEVASIALLNDTGTHLFFAESTDANFDALKSVKIPIGKGLVGFVAQEGRSVRIDDISADERYYGEVDRKLKHATKSYLCVPLTVNNKVIGTAQVMNRLDEQPFTAEDEILMNGFARQAALAIQNARLHSMLLQQEALESELKVCAEIQQKLFPSSIPKISGFEFYGETIPCHQVGGDYFSFIERPDGTMDAVLADVSGKGIPAAMLVSEIHTGLQILSMNPVPLWKMIFDLNTHLRKTMITGKFITLFCARITPDQGSFQYVTAGHPPPYIIRKDGSLSELNMCGPIIGITNINHTQQEQILESGDVMVIFSDDYSETMSPTGELFGEERIAECVKKNRTAPLKDIANALRKEALDFRHGEASTDDATLVLIRKL